MKQYRELAYQEATQIFAEAKQKLDGLESGRLRSARFNVALMLAADAVMRHYENNHRNLMRILNS